MADADAMVKAWLLDKWREVAASRAQWAERYGLGWGEGPPGDPHFANCPPVAVEVADMGWDCGCYSEFTRDDQFILTAVLRCKCGTTAQWQYGAWSDFPSFIEELDGYADLECPYEEEDGTT